MIKVEIVYKEGKFSSLLVKGHANSAPYGHDLVCAAVSAIVTGGANNLKNIDSFDIELKEGLASIKAIKEITNHDEIVLETIITGLKTVQESDKDFIKITEK